MGYRRAAVGAVAGDQQRVAPEQHRNLLLVVGEVFVGGGPCRHAGFFEFDHHPRQAIDEADQIGPASVERPGHAELADQQEIVIRQAFPVDDAQAFGLLSAVFAVKHRHRDAFIEQPIHLACPGQVLGLERAVLAGVPFMNCLCGCGCR